MEPKEGAMRKLDGLIATTGAAGSIGAIGDEDDRDPNAVFRRVWRSPEDKT